MSKKKSSVQKRRNVSMKKEQVPVSGRVLTDKKVARVVDDAVLKIGEVGINDAKVQATLEGIYADDYLRMKVVDGDEIFDCHPGLIRRCKEPNKAK